MSINKSDVPGLVAEALRWLATNGFSHTGSSGDDSGPNSTHTWQKNELYVVVRNDWQRWSIGIKLPGFPFDYLVDEWLDCVKSIKRDELLTFNDQLDNLKMYCDKFFEYAKTHPDQQILDCLGTARLRLLKLPRKP